MEDEPKQPGTPDERYNLAALIEERFGPRPPAPITGETSRTPKTRTNDEFSFDFPSSERERELLRREEAKLEVLNYEKQHGSLPHVD